MSAGKTLAGAASVGGLGLFSTLTNEALPGYLAIAGSIVMGAYAIWQAIVDKENKRLRAKIDQLQAEIDSVWEKVAKEREENAALREKVAGLEAKLELLLKGK